ncbi:MAG: hypothetical protein J4432_00470 [DPANN group archaeon]|nr:hypothetical protein [DPANN group archaeon]
MKLSLVLLYLVIIAGFFYLGLQTELPVKTQMIEKETIVYTVLEKPTNTTVEVSAFPSNAVTVYGIGVFRDTDTGRLVPIDVGLADGTGNTYIDVRANVFGKTFQDSLRIIRQVVARETNQDISRKDIFIKVQAPELSIEGESGSVEIALGLYSLIENKPLRESTIVSGTLQEDGSITMVEALETKVQVLENLGVKRFLYPATQKLPDNGFSIETIPIKNFSEAVKQSF